MRMFAVIALVALAGCPAPADDSASVDDTGFDILGNLEVETDLENFGFNRQNLFRVNQPIVGEIVTLELSSTDDIEVEVVELPANGGPAQYGFYAGPLPVRSGDGEMRVLWRGMTSNALTYAMPPVVDSIAPLEVSLADIVTISGTNFGASEGSVMGAATPVVSWSDTEVRFRVSPRVTDDVQMWLRKAELIDSDSTANQSEAFTLDTTGSVTASCAVSSEERCTVVGGNFSVPVGHPDPLADSSITVGGLAVTDAPGGSWTSGQISFFLPDGLAAGTHDAVLTNPAGDEIPFQVTKLGWTRHVVGHLDRFGVYGGTPEIEGTVRVLDGQPVVMAAAIGMTYYPAGSIANATGSALVPFTEPTDHRQPGAAWQKANWSGTWGLPGGSFYQWWQCMSSRVGLYGGGLYWTYTDGSDFVVDPLVSGDECIAGPRTLEVVGFRGGTGTGGPRFTMDPDLIDVGGFVEAGDYTWLLVHERAGSETELYVAANGVNTVWGAQDIWPYFGTGYSASDSTFYIAGGEDGWDGTIAQATVALDDEGFVQSLDHAEVPLPFVTSASPQERFTHFTGAADGSLVVVAEEDSGAVALYRWTDDSAGWTRWMDAPDGTIKDVGVHQGDPLVLMLDDDALLWVMRWDGSTWAPMGEALTGWWSDWVWCEGPFDDAGPDSGTDGCELGWIPRQLKQWRQRPGYTGRARMHVDEGFGIIVTFDNWLTDSIYHGDLGDDRQMVAWWAE